MVSTRGGSACAMALATLVGARGADACGGCFHGVSERASVVTDHRMALALSADETTLWDQVRWAGDPEDFVWALPLSDARSARVAVADDAFLNELDRATAPVVTTRFPSRCVSGDAGGDDASQAPPMSREEVLLSIRPMVRSSDPDRPVEGAPSVIPEATVGPYQTVILDGVSAGQRLPEWLAAHGFVVPAGGRAAVEHYTALNAGWVVLRLRPGEGVSRMSPVRVTLDGYQPTLPLRMIAAGAGDAMGLTLLVASNGAMREAGVPEVRVDARRLTWTADASRSNYAELFREALGGATRPVWVTESIVPWRPIGATGSSDEQAVMSAGGMLTRIRTIASATALDRDLRVEPSEAGPFGPVFQASPVFAERCLPTPQRVADDLLPLPTSRGCQCAAGAEGEAPRGRAALLLAVAWWARRRRAPR
jgi:MYXO-CTERM domain-containing protein